MVASRPKACCSENCICGVNGPLLCRVGSRACQQQRMQGLSATGWSRYTRSIDSMWAALGGGTKLRSGHVIVGLYSGGYGSVTSADHSQRVAWWVTSNV